MLLAKGDWSLFITVFPRGTRDLYDEPRRILTSNAKTSLTHSLYLESLSGPYPDTIMADCCIALLGVHLSGYHVVPLLLLHLGFGPWSNCHGGRCHVCAVHVLARLVRCFSAQISWFGVGAYSTATLGNSVSVTLNFETFVMSVKCSTLDGHGSGTLPPPCSYSTTPSSR